MSNTSAWSMMQNVQFFFSVVCLAHLPRIGGQPLLRWNSTPFPASIQHCSEAARPLPQLHLGIEAPHGHGQSVVHSLGDLHWISRNYAAGLPVPLPVSLEVKDMHLGARSIATVFVLVCQKGHRTDMGNCLRFLAHLQYHLVI